MKHTRMTRLLRRSALVLALLGLYYIVPWLMWDGHQAVLFDLPARKFYIFGLTLWPQDFPYLALLLMILAYSLFFFTAIGGRLFCGFACPQTVWTEIFIWMEQFTEGTRSRLADLLAARYEESGGVVPQGFRAMGIVRRYLAAGDYGKAIDWLEKAYEVHHPGLPYVGFDPRYDPLRSDPRFQDLLRRMNLPTTSTRADPDEQR